MKIKRFESSVGENGVTRLIVVCEINGKEYEFGSTVIDTDDLGYAVKAIQGAFARAAKSCRG